MEIKLNSIEELKFLKDIYTIDADSNIYSYSKGKNILTARPNKQGYLQVGLYDKEGKQHTFFVHRLVALVFLSRVEGKQFVNHLDEDKSNNKSSNLEWCTHLENINHGTRTERMGLSHRGLKKPGSGRIYQSVVATVIETGEQEVYNSKDEFVKAGFDQSAVSRCATGKRPTHKGRSWKYIT